jgi:DNA-directed RNA polymerase specialized sigma24 family protein
METGRSRRFGSQLTREALDVLLRRLHPDPAEAGREYIKLRNKLIAYFDFEKCPEADTLADEVLDRLARRLRDGEQVERIGAYSLGVARLVALETRQRETTTNRKIHEFLRISADVGSPEKQAGLDCLDHCLARLPAESRALILAYYSGDHAERIDNRKQIAQQLGMHGAALRNRALRLRAGLERCLKRCMRNSRDGWSKL